MNKKGFTLFETMVSITIFSVLMVIVFNAWTEFQKASIKSEGKQDVNIQFVNVYRNIDKVVSSSSVRLFRCCDDDDLPPEVQGYGNLRWSAFMLSRENNQLDGEPVYTDIGEKTSKRMKYNTCVVFLLHYPGCCGGFSKCPHKSIYRYVVGANNVVCFGDKAHKWGDELQENLKGCVLNILKNPDKSSHSVVENNIVDLRVEKNDDKLRFFLKILRTKDAKRFINVGTVDLVSPNNNVKKYLEDLSWISIPSNT